MHDTCKRRKKVMKYLVENNNNTHARKLNVLEGETLY